MMPLRLTPPALAALLLAAHFYRAGAWIAAALSIAAVALLFVPRPWAARAIQGGLAIGVIEWIRTAAMFTAQRIALGQPFVRLIVILAAVALLTGAALLVFRSPAVRARFGLARPA